MTKHHRTKMDYGPSMELVMNKFIENAYKDYLRGWRLKGNIFINLQYPGDCSHLFADRDYIWLTYSIPPIKAGTQ